MLTFVVLFALAASAWGAFEQACNIRKGGISVADMLILAACFSCVVTAFHSLVCIWK